MLGTIISGEPVVSFGLLAQKGSLNGEAVERGLPDK